MPQAGPRTRPINRPDPHSGRTDKQAGQPYAPPETPVGKINLTDLDSRNVKTPRAWVQGYNAQAVATDDQIVIAAEVTVDSPDFGHLEPIVSATETELATAGLEERPHVVLADHGYCTRHRWTGSSTAGSAC